MSAKKYEKDGSKFLKVLNESADMWDGNIESIIDGEVSHQSSRRESSLSV